MTHKEELLDALRRSFDGDAWHGPALQDVLADVNAEEALWKPARHVHSIWEITLHAAGWAREVASRLRGNAPAEPAGGDWREVGGNADEEGWQDAVQQVFEARDALLATVRDMAEADLDDTSGTSLEPAPGTGFSRAGLIAGITQHNAYHTGQIALLKKQVRCVT